MGKSQIQSRIMAYILQVSHYKLGLPVVGYESIESFGSKAIDSC